VLREYLDDFCSAYLNNVLIYSENETNYVKHCTKVLTQLKEAGLYLDIRKSKFYVT
jgi:hypothetical protein